MEVVGRAAISRANLTLFAERHTVRAEYRSLLAVSYSASGGLTRLSAFEFEYHIIEYEYHFIEYEKRRVFVVISEKCLDFASFV